ncbi:MAG TPA: 2,3-bisphosphoglycerate-independent phosphoglycerate mutase [Bacillota bacterium]|nr:2,3-bisphosphoglycerate-independent phosphoglycerate mutase [Bacillota bacterium]
MGYRPVALIILDGWGLNPRTEGNAVKAAKTPFLNDLFAKNPHATLLCSGEAVGLPEGQMGTSEVGHMNIGAGRVVYQSLVRISKALREGEFKQNQVFVDLMKYTVKEKRPLHLMGLVSPGGVHSHTDHLYGLIKLAKEYGVKQVFIHAFLDGRDTPPSSGLEYVNELEKVCREEGIGAIATVGGRYYGMDRDKRWERVEKAYTAMVDGEGAAFDSASQAIQSSYDQSVTDEFMIPAVIKTQGQPVGKINPGDPIIFFNFRPDRAREITRAFIDSDFNGFQRRLGFLNCRFVCMTQYDETLKVPLLFPPEGKLPNILAEVLGKNNMKELRIAETEKYAHVTFFFNGGEEAPFPLEERILIPSPKVATYDLQPEMSAPEVTKKVLDEIAADKFPVIIMNYANCDMVGHTGIMEAAIKAVETVDSCLSQVIPAILAKGGAVILTADHGNAEQMVDYQTGEPFTAHTTFPVPVLIAGLNHQAKLNDGSLADLAPTMLELLGISQPVEMTGKSLIRK